MDAQDTDTTHAQQHRKNLLNYCRLCKHKIVENDKHYPNPKTCTDLHEDIVNVYQIDCSRDCPNTYPKSVCKNCARNIKRYVKSGKQVEPAMFQPCTADKTCDVCVIEQKKYRPSPGPVKTHKKILDQCFLNTGFIIFSNGPPKIYTRLKMFEGNIIPDMSVTVEDNYSWSMNVCGRIITTISGFPHSQLNDDNIEFFTKTLKQLNVCRGNTKFTNLIQQRLEIEQPFKTPDGGTAALVETANTSTVLNVNSFDTLRHPNCPVIFKGDSNICTECLSLDKKCKIYEKRLVTQNEKPTVSRTSDTSNVNLRYLSKEELIEKVKNCQQVKRAAINRAIQLTDKINQMITHDGVQLDKTHHDMVKDVLQKDDPGFEEGTPQWLLWQQQAKYASLKDARSMRWHPLIVRFALSIYHSSPAAYRQLINKQNKFFMLPCVNTIRKYTNFTTPQSGFNPDIIARLIEDSKLKELKEYEKNVSIIFDEMKIKGDLVYDRATGKLVGFAEMGDINDELARMVEKTDEERDLARYVNVFMVRGIFTNLHYPFGHVASQGLTGDQLYPTCMEATNVLESIGFKVRAWIADGASPNRKFFKICESFSNPLDREVVHWTENPFDQSRKIYFFSDYCHLIKTTRNNLENSHGNRNSRNLHYDKHDISWNHIVQVYDWDLTEKPFGLRLLPQLTEDHVRLSPRLRMKVKLATQVLSTRVAIALEKQKKFYTKGTQDFIEKFDRLFDCLNGISSKNYGKPDRAPYRKSTIEKDGRVKFMLGVLDYLKKWRTEAESQTVLTKEEQGKRCLSLQTEQGWYMTIHSFIDLTNTLLDEEGVSFVLSEKFSQDPLEEHFGRQRRAGGNNENPTYKQFIKQEISLNNMGSDLIQTIRHGNASGKDKERVKIDVNDTRALPQAPKSKKRKT